VPAAGEQKKAGMIYQFKMEEFMKSMPHDQVLYMAMLQQTQGLSTLGHAFAGG
jgi:hypothetical protein